MTARLPSQKRSEERLASIVESAHRHYMEVGRDRFEIPRVAEMVGCTSGTIYYYFKDRYALLDHIAPHRDDAERLLQAVKAELASVPTPATKARPATPARAAEDAVDRIRYLLGQ